MRRPHRVYLVCSKCSRSLLVSVLFLAAGCATRTVYLEGHRAFPEEPMFTIQPREYSREELEAAGIRTDGVYVDVGFRPQEVQNLEERLFEKEGIVKGIPFVRFWANGRVMGRTVSSGILTAKAVDSFERARVGFFLIASNGVIEIERYMYDPGRRDYTYFRNRRVIEGDTLWSDTGRMHKGEPVQLGYRFVPIEGMTSQPDW